MTCCGVTRSFDGKPAGRAEGARSRGVVEWAVRISAWAGRVAEEARKAMASPVWMGDHSMPAPGVEFGGCAAGDGDAPEMAAVDVVFIGGIEDGAAVRSEGGELHFVFAG